MNHQTNHVFVLDKNRKPLQPCCPARARILQKQGKAKRLKTYPFTLILEKEVEADVYQEFEIRIDPGSKTTGIALIDSQTGRCLWALHIEHRGELIKKNLFDRAGSRRSRRTRNVRHRKARFNRTKPKGWLAPSLMHRVDTTITWIKRIMTVCNVTKISVEKVKFDTQLMNDPEIKGEGYQHGTLKGFTIKEYLLEKHQHQCAYCGAKDTPLEVEHIKAKSKGGTNRIDNLTIACHDCNQKKGNMDIEEFLKDDPKKLETIKKQQKQDMKDVAAVNSTKERLFEDLEKLGVEVVAGNGALTKMTRKQNGHPKDHWIDAANVAGLPVKLTTKQPLVARSTGHGCRQARKNNGSGFPAISNTEKAPLRKPREIKKGTVVIETEERRRVKKNKEGNRVPRIVSPKDNYTHCSAGDVVVVNITKDRFKKGTKEVQVSKGSYRARVKTPTKSGVEVKIGDVRVSVTSKETTYIHRNDGYSYSFAPVVLEIFKDIG